MQSRIASRKRTRSRYKIQVSLSSDALCLLDEMRDNSSMTRSTLIEMSIRKYYASNEASDLQLRNTKEDNVCQSVRRRFRPSKQ